MQGLDGFLETRVGRQSAALSKVIQPRLAVRFVGLEFQTFFLHSTLLESASAGPSLAAAIRWLCTRQLIR